jgi:methionyl-tRNA formyltransferase
MEYFRETKKMTLVLSAVNFYLITKDVVAKPNLDIVNYHNSILPRHPGRNAEAWQIYEQDELVGITLHYIDETIDGGFLITQRTNLPEEAITAGRLFQKLNKLAFETILEIMPALVMGIVKKTPLSTNSKDVHYSTDIPNDGELDLTWDYAKMSAFLRSLDFGFVPQFSPPYATIGKNLYCWKRYSLLPEESGSGCIFENGNLKVLTPTGGVLLKHIYQKEKQS